MEKSSQILESSRSNHLRFWNFCDGLGIGQLFQDLKTTGWGYGFSKEDTSKLFDLSNFFNFTSGGLVLGNSHKEGGIFLVQPFYMKDTGIYLYNSAEMEGNEYLVNSSIYEQYKIEFDEINQSTKPPKSGQNEDLPFSHDVQSKVLNVVGVEIPILFVNPGCFVINSHATKQHIKKL